MPCRTAAEYLGVITTESEVFVSSLVTLTLGQLAEATPIDPRALEKMFKDEKASLRFW
jgi:hypothetical protein